MSITSIGSSFSSPMPIQAPSPTAPVERIVVATAESSTENPDSRSGGEANRAAAQSTSGGAPAKASIGVLIAAQEQARSAPAVSARSAARAYTAA